MVTVGCVLYGRESAFRWSIIIDQTVVCPLLDDETVTRIYCKQCVHLKECQYFKIMFFPKCI